MPVVTWAITPAFVGAVVLGFIDHEVAGRVIGLVMFVSLAGGGVLLALMLSDRMPDRLVPPHPRGPRRRRSDRLAEL